MPINNEKSDRIKWSLGVGVGFSGVSAKNFEELAVAKIFVETVKVN